MFITGPPGIGFLRNASNERSNCTKLLMKRNGYCDRGAGMALNWRENKVPCTENFLVFEYCEATAARLLL